MFKLKLDLTKARKVVSEEDTTIDNLVEGHGVNDIEHSVVETAMSEFASTNKTENKTEKDSENIDTQTPGVMNNNVLNNNANNGTNVILTNEAAKGVQHSSFIIHDQYGNPSLVTLPSDTTFVVQNFLSYVPATNSAPAVLGELPEKKAGDEIKNNGAAKSDSPSNRGSDSDSDSEGANKSDEDMDKNEEKEDKQEPVANDVEAPLLLLC